MIKIGLVGLPNVGKSTSFSFLTKKNVLIANYPFATISPNVGIMLVPDNRLEQLAKSFSSAQIVHSVLEWVDIAGLVKGAAQGSGLGNEFLSHIREVDLICQVVRCFKDDNIEHVENSINPIRDYEIIELELISADLQQIKKRLEKLKPKDEKHQKEAQVYRLIQENLEKGILINQLKLSEKEKKMIKGYNFLTDKPFLLLANYSGNEEEIEELKEYAKKKRISFFALAVKLEKEIALLSPEEKKEIGWQGNALSLLTEKIKKLLNLITFFTTGKDETRSWLKKITTSRESAGMIHSDIRKGFIRVEVYNYQDWLTNPDETKLKKLGKIRDEGPQYIIQEGDICYFLFN